MRKREKSRLIIMILHAECFFAPVACMKAENRLSTPSVGLPQWRQRERERETDRNGESLTE